MTHSSITINCRLLNLSPLGPRLTCTCRTSCRSCRQCLNTCSEGRTSSCGGPRRCRDREASSYCREKDNPKHGTDFELSYPVQFNHAARTTARFVSVRTSEHICLCLPGCIDPDYVQVAEVVTLRVHQTAARTALGPHSVRREAASSLHFQMFVHWEGQSWSETGTSINLKLKERLDKNNTLTSV